MKVTANDSAESASFSHVPAWQPLLLGNPETQEALIEAARDQAPVTGLTHNFYRYPARFSPRFVRAAIEAFTSPGDCVVDPFVGGGTTLVEALALGRHGVGIDISELATFVAEVKTTLFSTDEFNILEQWASRVPKQVDKVVRWRCVDLQAEVVRRFSVEARESTIGKWLSELGLTRLQPRPVHPKKDAAAETAFKNVWPALSARDFFNGPQSLLQCIRPRSKPRPRWRSARPNKRPRLPNATAGRLTIETIYVNWWDRGAPSLAAYGRYRGCLTEPRCCATSLRPCNAGWALTEGNTTSLGQVHQVL